MSKLIFALALFFLPLASRADPDYRYCEITGLAYGAGREFIATVAARLVEKQGLIADSGCQAVWADAFQKGKRLDQGGKMSALDLVTWGKLQSFTDKVSDSIIRDLQLGH